MGETERVIGRDVDRQRAPQQLEQEKRHIRKEKVKAQDQQKKRNAEQAKENKQYKDN